MTLTLLLDLDDTLLTTDADFFQGLYVKALCSHLGKRIEPRALASQLMVATMKMVQNDRPEKTLEAVFDASFYPALGILRSDYQDDIDSFYAQVFPTLRSWTKPRPAAVKLVEQAFQRGYQVAIATNPLFPKTAILQRLEWAGLSPEKYPYKVISSYETFHFAKPNPAYFAEVLAQMGWPEGPVVMVGNDLAEDISPALQLGIKTFYINGETVQPGMNPDGQIPVPGMHGDLLECLEWLDISEESSLQPDFTQPAALLGILKSTPAGLDTLLKAVPEHVWPQRPMPDEWSLTEILCHLRDVEIEVNLPRFERITVEENPFIPGQVTDPWAEERGYIQQDGQAAQVDFVNARKKTLEIIYSSGPGVWDRQVRHAIFGPTRVRELVDFITTHDRTHIHQVVETVDLVKQPS